MSVPGNASMSYFLLSDINLKVKVKMYVEKLVARVYLPLNVVLRSQQLLDWISAGRRAGSACLGQLLSHNHQQVRLAPVWML